MDKDDHTPRLEVFPGSGPGRRRRRTEELKICIVEESLREGAILTEVAYRHEVSRSQLYKWRRRYRADLLGPTPCFSEVVPQDDEVVVVAPPEAPHPPETVVELVVELGRRIRITIPASFDMAAAACLLRGLS